MAENYEGRDKPPPLRYFEIFGKHSLRDLNLVERQLARDPVRNFRQPKCAESQEFRLPPKSTID
jgi:hypothetical protein